MILYWIKKFWTMLNTFVRILFNNRSTISIFLFQLLEALNKKKIAKKLLLYFMKNKSTKRLNIFLKAYSSLNSKANSIKVVSFIISDKSKNAKSLYISV